MKGFTLSALLATAVAAWFAPVASTIYRDAYPSDLPKRQALALCLQADSDFNRLLAGARAACYGRRLPALAPVAPQAHVTEPHLAGR